MLKIYSYLYKSVMLLLMSAFALTASAQADRKFIRNGNRLYRQQQFAKAEAEYRKALSATHATLRLLTTLVVHYCSSRKTRQQLLSLRMLAKQKQASAVRLWLTITWV